MIFIVGYITRLLKFERHEPIWPTFARLHHRDYQPNFISGRGIVIKLKKLLGTCPVGESETFRNPNLRDTAQVSKGWALLPTNSLWSHALSTLA